MQEDPRLLYHRKGSPWLHVVGKSKYSRGQTLFIDSRATSEFLSQDNKMDFNYASAYIDQCLLAAYRSQIDQPLQYHQRWPIYVSRGRCG